MLCSQNEIKFNYLQLHELSAVEKFTELLSCVSSFLQVLAQKKRLGLRPGITAGPLEEICLASTVLLSYDCSGTA